MVCKVLRLHVAEKGSRNPERDCSQSAISRAAPFMTFSPVTPLLGLQGRQGEGKDSRTEVFVSAFFIKAEDETPPKGSLIEEMVRNFATAIR